MQAPALSTILVSFFSISPFFFLFPDSLNGSPKGVRIRFRNCPSGSHGGVVLLSVVVLRWSETKEPNRETIFRINGFLTDLLQRLRVSFEGL